MQPTAARWSRWPRILAEDLQLLAEPPLGPLLTAGPLATPPAVARRAALALLDLPPDGPVALAPWLAPHQRPAARRLLAILDRHSGAILADAVGLGKSYVALAVAQARADTFALVVPAVLTAQWRALLARLRMSAVLVTHEALSHPATTPGVPDEVRLLIVDEAHRFRNPETRRYRALARLAAGRRTLLVTATPLHNRHADPLHLLRLFLRDDALAALGVASLRVAARERVDPRALRAAVTRFMVARSRQRAIARGTGPQLVFPRRGRAEVIRAAPASDARLRELGDAITSLDRAAPAAALVRLLLLSRLASSLPALRSSVTRLDAFGAAAAEAARDGRSLASREFARWFPGGEAGEIQLAFTSLIVTGAASGAQPVDRPGLRRVLALLADAADPKADALDALLTARPAKTIVFTTARATAIHLARRLGRRHRVAVVTGDAGLWGHERVGRHDVLRAFAPRAQGAAPPPRALVTDVLIATDLVSEGLDLQDATRVVHYDLPWSPARLAQRVGRIDRLGSPHAAIETVAFVPPRALARTMRLEERLARKLTLQRTAGAAATEAPRGPGRDGALDWCDRLQTIAESPAAAAPLTAWCRVTSPTPAVILVVQFGGTAGLAEAIVVDASGCRSDPVRATTLLETAAHHPPAAAASDDRRAVTAALVRAAPLIRTRIRMLGASRWRAADRDAVGRRLIPWVLAAARGAARAGDAPRLARLDSLVTRLARGMTAGEELALRALIERDQSLLVDDLLAWGEHMTPLAPDGPRGAAELIAAFVAR